MIYLYWAAPSQGKTMFVTKKAIDILLEGKKKVFSNYPIVYHKPLRLSEHIKNLITFNANIVRKLLRKSEKEFIREKVYSSMRWKEEYVYSGITDSVIIFDEAYMFKGFSSRDKMDKDTQSFFATNGHDNNDIHLIAQHYNRLELILREMASYYVYIYKISNPFSKRNDGKSGGREGELKPFMFIAEYYISEDDFKYRRIKNTVYKTERYLFNKRIGNAYDTKFFRKQPKLINPEKWSDIRDRNLQEIEDIREKENKAIDEFINYIPNPTAE